MLQELHANYLQIIALFLKNKEKPPTKTSFNVLMFCIHVRILI